MRSLIFLLCALLGASAQLQAAELRISGLEDITLGEVAPSSSTLTRRLRACVSMTPAGPFQLTAIGNGRDGAFALSNPSADVYQIPYEVVAGQRAGARSINLLPGVPHGSFSAREPHRDGRCRPPELSIFINIDARKIGQVPPGRYSGQLQLIVSPE